MPPGYDMLSTALLMPEDTEELALTLNGKRRKIKRSDFEVAMNGCSLEKKGSSSNLVVSFSPLI